METLKMLSPISQMKLDEQKKILNVLKNEDVRYSDIMLLSMFTGMRIGECCALMIEDIDLEEKTISISKTVARGKYGRKCTQRNKNRSRNKKNSFK